MDITFETRGNTFFEHQTSISFNIDGEEYWFTMIEKGDINSTEPNDVEFITDEDLPFEITDEMKEQMYILACEHPIN